MNTLTRNYFLLTIIYLALIGLGYLLINIFNSDLMLGELLTLLTGAYIISIITSIVFFRGLKKGKGKGVLHTLSAVGLKFLLFLALLGIFAIIMKELSWHFLLAFFIAYLSFTIYLLINFINILQKKNQAKPDDKGK